MKRNALLGAFLGGLAMVALLGASPTPPMSTPITVHIKDFAFHPPTLTITAGQTVRFINDDQDAHTVTGVGFDSEGLDTGDSWTHTFDKPGTYMYYCELHPYMKGTIVVRAAGK